APEVRFAHAAVSVPLKRQNKSCPDRVARCKHACSHNSPFQSNFLVNVSWVPRFFAQVCIQVRSELRCRCGKGENQCASLAVVPREIEGPLPAVLGSPEPVVFCQCRLVSGAHPFEPMRKGIGTVEPRNRVELQVIDYLEFKVVKLARSL